MKVNGIDIKEKYNPHVTLLEQKTEPREIVSFFEWLETSNSPMQPQPPGQRGFEIYVDMIVSAGSKSDAEILMGNIERDCLTGEIQLDRRDFIYAGELREVNREFLNRWKYHMELTFYAWDKSGPLATYTIDRLSTGTVPMTGNMETPCILAITPSISLADMTITGAAHNPRTGADEPITIRNLTAGRTIVINGEDETIMEGAVSKFASCDLWCFPSLVPGNNTLNFSRNLCDVTIKYKPRYS